MPRLEGKVAIVTGGGSGIGAAAVQLFADEGASVIVVDLDEEAARPMADAVDGTLVVGSVADPATWEQVVEAATERGGVHLAYLNAGLYGWDGAIDELPLDLYERTVGANIGGVVLGVRALVPM